jgi:hypothetical protein
MATPKKKPEVATSRNAGLPQAERRASTTVRTSREVEPSYDEISQRAREIWERNGCLPGRDLENWLQAESELKNGHASV